MGIMYRHKCFISYHKADKKEVEDFVKAFANEGDCFIARAVGVMDQDIIDSNDKNYVMRRIREQYLTDSTVTIVMVGKCTWARKYVDWEIASTLRNDPNNKRSGLMAITLPSANQTKVLPARFNDNWSEKGESYAKWYKYPTTSESLANMIEDAFQARTSRTSLIDNNRDLFSYNRTCG